MAVGGKLINSMPVWHRQQLSWGRYVDRILKGEKPGRPTLLAISGHLMIDREPAFFEMALRWNLFSR